MVCIQGSPDSTDLDRMVEGICNNLPSYARPLFFRFTDDLDMTGRDMAEIQYWYSVSWEMHRYWLCHPANFFQLSSEKNTTQGCGSGSAYIFPPWSGSKKEKFWNKNRKKCKEIASLYGTGTNLLSKFPPALLFLTFEQSFMSISTKEISSYGYF